MKRSERLLTMSLAALPSLAAGAASAYEGAGNVVDPAAGWNHLWNEVLIDITIIGVVFAIAALYMLIRFRATSPTQVGRGPKLKSATALAFVLVPSAIFLADDFFLAAKGWTLWNVYRRVPADAMEVKVTAHQWYYDFDYGNGVTVTATPGSEDNLKVPLNRPVVMRMTADDVIHSFSLPYYRVKEDVMPGRVTYLWFLPNKPGKEVITCTMFCGDNHSQMYSTVEALPPAQFEAWLASQKKQAQDNSAKDHKG